MTVSLIIPYYNGSRYINEALCSAENQTVKFDEIIVVDDGSIKRESDYILQLLHAKYPSIVYYYKDNGGQGDARNYGVLKSSGKYVCFLDQDDRLSPEHNHVLGKAIVHQSHPQGWVFANFNTMDHHGNIFSRNSLPHHSMLNVTNVYQLIDHDLFVLPTATIFSKETFMRAGGFDKQFKGYEDDDLIVRLYISGANYDFINKAVYDWRMHNEQTSGSTAMSESRLRFIKKWYFYDFGMGVDVGHFRRSLLKRFKSTIARDVINCRNSEALNVLRGISREFVVLGKECGMSSLRDLLAVKLTTFLPQYALIPLVKIYVFFKAK